MHIPRFFCPGPLPVGAAWPLPPAAAHHALRVLRLAPGDRLQVFDGSGNQCAGTVVQAEGASCRVLLEAPQQPAVESPLQVILGQGLASADKFDLILQKAVELGVAAVDPLALRRSVVRLDGERAARRLQHWQGVLTAACEQCGRVRLPRLGAVQTLADWLPGLPAQSLRLRLDPGAGAAVAALVPPPAGVVLVVGPEGGFDPAEEAQLDAAGFVGVRLGPRVLRTETAALAALAALQAWHGDFRAGAGQAL